MRIAFFLVGLFFLTACKKSVSNSGSVINPAVGDTLADINYGSNEQQKMDIYLPPNRSVTSTKVLFLIHGGGWAEGDKADFTGSVGYLQSNLPDFAIVNINYRLVANNQNLFPTQEDDVKAAVQFIFNKKNEYTLSDKWAFLGASAGAHLALLQSYKYSSPVKAKAVVSFYGPTDLTTFYNSDSIIAALLPAVTGTTPVINPTLYQQSSPITFITAQSSPTMALHGGADPVVPYSQAVELIDKLQAAGVANQFVFYPADGHGWTGIDLLDSYTKVVIFLKQYVN